MFHQLINQTFTELSQNQKPQELRKAYSQFEHAIKGVQPKVKLESSFWNNDIQKIELEMSKLLHEVAYFDKPDIWKQPNFQINYQEYLSKKATVNVTFEAQRVKLLKFFEQEVANMYLERKWMVRHKNIKSVRRLNQPYYDTINFQEYNLQTPDDSTNPPHYSNYHIQGQPLQPKIKDLEKKIMEYNHLCDMLAAEKIVETQQQFNKTQIQLSQNGNDNLIFDKVNMKLLEIMPYLTLDHLKDYYIKSQNKLISDRSSAHAKIYLESALYRAQFETVLRPSEQLPEYKYSIPQDLKSLKEQFQIKANQLNITQDMNVDNGALFLYAVDKLFSQEVEMQSLEYLKFLPYGIEFDQQAAIASTMQISISKQIKQSFQQYTVRMLSEMQQEQQRNNQYRVRSAAHWVDNIQILPDTKKHTVFTQYEDTTIKSWMNFLLYHEIDKINTKISKDVLLRRKKHLPDIYFEFYTRFLKVLYMDSRKSLIMILNVLNVFRSAQKNLNIYYLELNSMSHKLKKEYYTIKHENPLHNQQDAFNGGIFDDSIYHTNPYETNQANNKNHSSIEAREQEGVQTNSYFCEEQIFFDENVFRVSDIEGFKILNESALQDFYQLQQTLVHISSYVLDYTSKHGFEESNEVKTEQQRIHDDLNREKIVQEVLNFEEQWLSAKCRILIVLLPLIKTSGPNIMYNGIAKLTHLMALRPDFELKNRVFANYLEQCELMKLVAIISEKLNAKGVKDLKFYLQIFDVAFPNQILFSIEQRRMALIDFYHNQVLPLPTDYNVPLQFKHLYYDPILDRGNNFDVLIQSLNDQPFNSNVFTLLEFQKVRNRIAKTFLRLKYNFDIYQDQFDCMGKNFLKTVPLTRSASIASNQSEAQSEKNNQEILLLFLDKGISLSSEINKLENWHPIAADSFKILDLTIVTSSLVLINSFTSNAIQINNLLLKDVVEKSPGITGTDLTPLFETQLNDIFINLIVDKSRLSLIAQSNNRKKMNYKEDEDKQHEPSSFVYQLLSANQAKGSLSEAQVQLFVKKLHGNILQELNLLLLQKCIVTSQTVITLNQREFLISLHKKLPFKVFQINECQYHKAQMIDTLTDEEVSGGLFDARGNIQNIFVIPSIQLIFKASRHTNVKENGEQSERIQQSQDSKAYTDEHRYRPGGEEWVKTQKLKIDQNTSLLTPTKKLSKFRSAGYPYTGKLQLELSPQLFLLSSVMSGTIQLFNQLFSYFSSQCNRADLLFFWNDLLGDDNQEFTRNRLRLQKDLGDMIKKIDQIQSTITKIVNDKNVLQTNQAVLRYICKITNRIHLSQLTMTLTCLNYFRHSSDQKDIDVISILRRLLVQIQYRNVGQVDQTPGEQPRIMRTLFKPNNMADKYSPQMLLLKHVFSSTCEDVRWSGLFNQHRSITKVHPLDHYTQLSPYMLPSQQTVLHSLKLRFNPCAYFQAVQLLNLRAYSQTYSELPQSRLIYYSTIQESITTEVDQAMRNAFIFEQDDPFHYERTLTKIYKIQLKFLILSEFVLMNRFKQLPFSYIYLKDDPIQDILLNSHKIIHDGNRKHNIKTSLLLGIANVSHQITSAVKHDLEKHGGIGKGKKQQTKQSSHHEVQDKLRVDSIQTAVFKLVSLLIETNDILIQEGLHYYRDTADRVAKDYNNRQISMGSVSSQRLIVIDDGEQMDIHQVEMQARLIVARSISNFMDHFRRDSLKIQTLNFGEAHVISGSNFDNNIRTFNHDLLNNVEQHLLDTLKVNLRQQEELQKMYNIKSLQNAFQYKKIRFYETHISHIVESLVAQKTSELIAERDKYKNELEETLKAQEIKEYKLRDEIRREFFENLQEHASKYQVLRNRFDDFKKGMTMELNNFIEEYRIDTLKQIKEKTIVALRDSENPFTTAIDPTISLEPTSELDAQERFLEENKQVQKLFAQIKQMRIFYQFKESTIRQKFEDELQKIREANSSNQDLQKKIGDLTDRIEALKDELNANKRIMTVMDNQNQILRRDLQKLKIDRVKAMKDRGIMGAASYHQKLGEQKQQQPAESDIKEKPSPRSTINTMPNIPEAQITMNANQSYQENITQFQTRPMTAVSTRKGLRTLDRSAKAKSEIIPINQMQTSKSAQVIPVKYRIQKK